MKHLRDYFQGAKARLKERFTNEIGNSIEVTVEQVKDTGTNAQGQKVSFDAVKIALEGPTSLSENTVTFMEARKIHEYLGKFLSTHKS